jgi:hypothetical protein
VVMGHSVKLHQLQEIHVPLNVHVLNNFQERFLVMKTRENKLLPLENIFYL